VKLDSVNLNWKPETRKLSMPSRPRILVVDDEPQITRVLRTTLNAQGYEIRAANDGETALEILKDFTPDLVITDLVMPNVNGIELCRQLRKTSQVPILVLSVRGEERSKIEALDSGADDYITKPFSTGELLARVRAALRRAPPSGTAPKTKIEAGDFRIDVDAHSVLVAGHEVRLTPKEFDVLLYMAQHPRKVLTHRAILNAVWGANSMEQNEYLRVFVGQLRKKLEPDASSPKYILTEPWVGYRFEPGD
jgi:two-component system, OmpR family, KDP operon response regulator KdpE